MPAAKTPKPKLTAKPTPKMTAKPTPKPTAKKTPKPTATPTPKYTWGTIQRYSEDKGTWYDSTEKIDSKGNPAPPSEGGIFISDTKYRPKPTKK